MTMRNDSHIAEMPIECVIGCPPNQVCDYCQGESGMDKHPPAPLDGESYPPITTLATLLSAIEGRIEAVKENVRARSELIVVGNTVRHMIEIAPVSETQQTRDAVLEGPLRDLLAVCEPTMGTHELFRAARQALKNNAAPQGPDIRNLASGAEDAGSAHEGKPDSLVASSKNSPPVGAAPISPPPNTADVAVQVLGKLVEQIQKCAPIDDHGHEFKMNQAYITAQVYLQTRKP